MVALHRRWNTRNWFAGRIVNSQNSLRSFNGEFDRAAPRELSSQLPLRVQSQGGNVAFGADLGSDPNFAFDVGGESPETFPGALPFCSEFDEPQCAGRVLGIHRGQHDADGFGLG